MSGRILVTGGAGFIGSAVCRRLISDTDCQVLNLDKLTYAGNLKSVQLIAEDPRYTFVRGDICDATLVSRLLNDFRPDAIMHLAAETHVDRSIAASRDSRRGVPGTTGTPREMLGGFRGAIGRSFQI